jgi:hypothetical protein
MGCCHPVQHPRGSMTLRMTTVPQLEMGLEEFEAGIPCFKLFHKLAWRTLPELPGVDQAGRGPFFTVSIEMVYLSFSLADGRADIFDL